MTLTAARLSKGGDSTGHPTGAALKAAGIGAFGIYIVGEFAAAMSVVEDYSAHGIIIYSLFERAAGAVAGGANQGAIDARDAVVAARALRQPMRSGIIFADDNSSVPQATVLDYWRGCDTIPQSSYRVGGYGPHAVCSAGLSAKVIDLAIVAAGWEDGQPDGDRDQASRPAVFGRRSHVRRGRDPAR